MNTFTEPFFQNADEARAKIESIRWPNGPVCGKCGETQRLYATKKDGRYRCGNPECRKDFTVTTGTVMESSHIPLNKWLMAFYLICASKKGISSHQLMRSLGVTYKSAWFLSHRVREAMKAGGLTVPLGGEDEIVEADETYHGKSETRRVSAQRKDRPFTRSGKSGGAEKRIIVSLVERGGSVRSFHVGATDRHTMDKLLSENVAKESRLHTDESRLYVGPGKRFASHETVVHSHKEYARGDVHVNSAEGFFGLFKRGFNGVYQHCREKHLHRYLAEFDFRYNRRIRHGWSDMDRTLAAIKGADGKRLTYRQTDGA
jgi:transposase-like protein